MVFHLTCKLSQSLGLPLNRVFCILGSSMMSSTINRANDHEYASKKIKLDDDEAVEDIEEIEIRVGQYYKSYKVSEKDAFITEFLGGHKGFAGEIKQRYSDFMVHEVDEKGQVVQLTDTSAPPEDVQPVTDNVGPVSDCISPEIHQKLVELSINKKAEHVDIGVDCLEKDERTKIHKYIKENYKGLETNYVEKDGQKVISVIRKGQSARQNSIEWPVGKPDFVHFVLYQENHGTLEAVEKIARFTGRLPKCYAYAGTKDKRSISTQRVSAFRQNIAKLIQLNDILGKNSVPIMVGNITFEKDPIRLGQTRGNRFDLVLRDLAYEKDSDIHDAFHNITTKGFINYFGTQRFGMSAAPSHSIGLAVLKEDWLGALDLILSERKVDVEPGRQGQHKSFNECMKIWKTTRDPEAVLKDLSFRNSREARILKGIIKSGSKSNYFAGFCQLTRNQRMLYLHAYQSLLWNQIASFRIKRYGLKVVPGDLVITDKEKLDQADDLKHITPRIANEEDIGSTTIDDVVLPILGVNTMLPENEVKDKLMELLSNDGLDVSAFSMKQKELHLAGTYRSLICRPQDMQIDLVSYDDNTQQLFLTDVDKLRGRELKVQEGAKKALKLSFTLPSSTYATIMLREMMKKDMISFD